MATRTRYQNGGSHRIRREVLPPARGLAARPGDPPWLLPLPLAKYRDEQRRQGSLYKGDGGTDSRQASSSSALKRRQKLI